MTSTPLSEEDEKTAERLVSYLKRVSDQDLDLIYESQERAAATLLSGFARGERTSLDEFPPPFNALMHFRDFVVAEQHQRQDAIRHAEAELLNDGHLEPKIWPYLDAGNTT